MTTIYYPSDADASALDGQRVAIVGYGNQGRSWALNLRDAGLDPTVCVRRDETRDRAEAEGFAVADIAAADDFDIVCMLVPDDVIPEVGLTPRGDALVVVATGYTPAFGRFEPECDIVMIAPRMIGPEVRACFEEGVGFMTAVGVHADPTGTAKARMLALAAALGGLTQGGIELTLLQEAVLDLAVEQVLSPALAHVSASFVTTMLENDIPLEAILCELYLSGEVERTYGRLRTEGFARQLQHHSPASQFGQLDRRGRFDHLDVAATMRAMTDHITSGGFADEWDAERASGHEKLRALVDQHAGPAMIAMDDELRARLGPDVGR